jgi:hypothetical protein
MLVLILNPQQSMSDVFQEIVCSSSVENAWLRSFRKDFYKVYDDRQRWVPSDGKRLHYSTGHVS